MTCSRMMLLSPMIRKGFFALELSILRDAAQNRAGKNVAALADGDIWLDHDMRDASASRLRSRLPRRPSVKCPDLDVVADTLHWGQCWLWDECFIQKSVFFAAVRRRAVTGLNRGNQGEHDFGFRYTLIADARRAADPAHVAPDAQQARFPGCRVSPGTTGRRNLTPSTVPRYASLPLCSSTA